ncbi:membrane protein [Endomicrobiia bacterium]|uniref:Diadenylate cyclase n=1 Tax=Endomicrobium trichonymphae TaxID=1408204 RepID=B1GZL0_ENDTX|nr:diadenylate cyclase CdaA [Candidatus Endomicrobium trichonymphae]GHT06589.1 membrane protein [Endomicrobiia bacterium]BAG13692.1 diadenylate cyclase N-terminal domain protein [Candidatus Endomicrobium trichonymphae]GHT12718.1 membrane protein [Endomicrobiia bacterium]GHT20131.1 membrane protein [Endomicrobiia bacterium]GHT27748.1 membrane protein [Endomicrobiia bacterium]
METMLNIYNTYIVNILDIFILAIVFYRVVLIIKGTMAIQIIVGILFILGFTIVAEYVLYLRVLSWLLSRLWVTAVVIFAVIFQTEIRSVLARLGGQLWGLKAKVKDSYIIEIVEAVEDLSVSMSGGLIAIEKEIGLKNFAETGIPLNADISKELLLSIFKNKSAPLHDGAIIIFKDKISAAGCLLPLNNDTGVEILGTRHRSALGLSEVTDAVIIVVSEETGRISVAYKGELSFNISSAELRKIISINGEAEVKMKRLYIKMRENWQLKLLALCLAIFVWLYVVGYK